MMKTSYLAKIKSFLDIPNTHILLVTNEPKEAINLLKQLPDFISSKFGNIRYTYNSLIEVRKVKTLQDAFMLAGYEFQVIIYDVFELNYDVHSYLLSCLRTISRNSEYIFLQGEPKWLMTDSITT